MQIDARLAASGGVTSKGGFNSLRIDRYANHLIKRIAVCNAPISKPFKNGVAERDLWKTHQTFKAEKFKLKQQMNVFKCIFGKRRKIALQFSFSAALLDIVDGLFPRSPTLLMQEVLFGTEKELFGGVGTSKDFSVTETLH